jgi:membrane AbrB-like protein
MTPIPFVTTLVAALAGAALLTLLKMPAGPLIGAMLAVGILKITGLPTLDIPSGGRFVIYCAVGWLLGQTITAEALVELRQAVVPILVCVLLFIVFGLLLAYALWRFADFDVYTAFLSTAPGGIAQMGVLSAESKANAPLVLTVHVLRITSVIMVASIGMRLLGDRL